MSGAHVNQAARQDTVGVILRQKKVLGRVSEVLCDGLGERPADVWRSWANRQETPESAGRLQEIADLIESENF